jgi:hypothetical protein
MKLRILSRIIVALVLGTVVAFWSQHRLEKRRLEGREAFLAEQSERWDRIYAHSDGFTFAAGFVVGISGAVLVFGAYEVLVAGAYRLLRKSAVDDKHS